MFGRRLVFSNAARRPAGPSRPSPRSEITDPHPIGAGGDCDLGVPIAKIAVEQSGLILPADTLTCSPMRHCGLYGWVVGRRAGCGVGWPCEVRLPGGGFCRFAEINTQWARGNHRTAAGTAQRN